MSPTPGVMEYFEFVSDNGNVHECEAEMFYNAKLKCDTSQKDSLTLVKREGWKQTCVEHCVTKTNCSGFQFLQLKNKKYKCKFLVCNDILKFGPHPTNVGVIVHREGKCYDGYSTKSPTVFPTTSPTFRPTRSPTTATPSISPTASPIQLPCHIYNTKAKCSSTAKRKEQCVWKRDKCRLFTKSPTKQPTSWEDILASLPPTTNEDHENWHFPFGVTFCGGYSNKIQCEEFLPACYWKTGKKPGCKRDNSISYGISCDRVNSKDRCLNREVCHDNQCFPSKFLCSWDAKYEVCEELQPPNPYYYYYDYEETKEEYEPYDFYDLTDTPTTPPPIPLDYYEYDYHYE
ncbi:MAG: PT domain-containing protein [Promethearchaeota archaeon]